MIPTPTPECEPVRESLSAGLDLEPGQLPDDAVAPHLLTCAACRTWQEQAHELTRRVRLAPARPVPDATESVVAAVLADRASRAPRHRVLRVAIAGVAAVQLAAVVVPVLVLGAAGADVPVHAARELAVFNLALALGLLAAVVRPALARGVLYPVAAASGLLILLSVADTVAGETTLIDELPHVVALVGTLLLIALTRRLPRTVRAEPSPSERAAVLTGPSPPDA